MPGQSDEPVLLVQVEARYYALPLQHVREILRPLPVENVTGAPPFVLGVSVVRGVATPVVDLQTLLGGTRELAASGRWVRLRVGNRDVLLAVDAAPGVRSLDAARLESLPPLLEGAAKGGIEQLTMLDERLLRILSAGLRIPDDAFASLPHIT